MYDAHDAPYARRDDNDSGTAVPEMWTQRQMPTTSDEPAYPDPNYRGESNIYGGDPSSAYGGEPSSAYQGEPSYQDTNYREESAYTPETNYRGERDTRRKHKGKHKA
jgi:hypothetical protein